MSATDPLVLIDAALRGTLSALLLTLTVVLWRERSQLVVVRIGLALCLGLCVQVFASTPLFEAIAPRLWQAPLVAVSVGNAVLFWLFALALFDDEFSFKPLYFMLWVAVAGMSGLNCAVLANSGLPFADISFAVQRGAPLVFAVLAAVAAARHWQSDLVEPRRRLRAFIVLTGIVYTIASLLMRLGSPQGRMAAPAAMVDVLVLLVIVAVTASRLLKLGSTELFPSSQLAFQLASQPAQTEAVSDRDLAGKGIDKHTPDSPEQASQTDSADDSLAQALQQLMKDQRAYRSEDLSLASLATRLQVPEYRLRRLINQRLGHRNFNAYINGFRLDEACAALRDPARRELPVLSIALESGFQSIGPFNRAFKAATGLTPSEFRKLNMADS
ncbi:helix-turn-helix domain-containing protein [Undibacterium sp. TJN19]|uniref:helix-turn-helix domain-containing protein n=1 Tax=Undibacterium sp. TJN19 TaxID=3413055 RepID=UPI003BF0FB5F